VVIVAVVLAATLVTVEAPPAHVPDVDPSKFTHALAEVKPLAGIVISAVPSNAIPLIVRAVVSLSADGTPSALVSVVVSVKVTPADVIVVGIL
jgi:hypothetical protein